MSSASELDLLQSPDCDDGSNNDLTVSSHLEYRDGTVPLITKTGSGHMSPVKARTMKEYDQEIADLKKENFSLKLRIYFLEERMKESWDGDSEDVFKQNIELNVEVESLKKDLIEKQELLKKASSALTSLSNHHQVELRQARDAGIDEGQRMANGEVEDVRLCIESLQKELNAKNEEIENLQIQTRETELKLNELLSINRLLDTRWREMEREKKDLEMRLDLLSATEKDTKEDDCHDALYQDVADEVVRKDGLIEQLRCALKAKDVIIQQVEEERKEAVKETTAQLQKRISQLQAKCVEYGIEMAEEVVVGRPDIRLKSPLGAAKRQGSSLHREWKFSDGTVQTPCKGGDQTNDTQDTPLLHSPDHQYRKENEKLKRHISRKEKDVVQFMEQLEKADQSLRQQDQEIKELRTSLQQERQKNSEKMAELDIQHKGQLDETQRHSANQDQAILHLTQSLQQRDEQLQKLLHLNDLTNVTEAHLKMAEVFREMRKENEAAIEEVVEESNMNVKSKNEEISHLRKELGQRMEEAEKIKQELSDCRQTIADMEEDDRFTDRILRQMTNILQDQQLEYPELEDLRGNALSLRERMIRLLRASLAARDGLCEEAADDSWVLNDSADMLRVEHLSLNTQPLSAVVTDDDSSRDVQHVNYRGLYKMGTPPTKLRSNSSGPKEADLVFPLSLKQSKSQQTDTASGIITGLSDGEELAQLRAEVKHLKSLLESSEPKFKTTFQGEKMPVSQERRHLLLKVPDGATVTALEDESALSPENSFPNKVHHHLGMEDSALQAFPGGSSPSGFAEESHRISPRESRVTPPRSNISYLSVESSKRLSAEERNMNGRHVAPESQSILVAFRALVPDESMLSEKSVDELKNIICNMSRMLHEPNMFEREKDETRPSFFRLLNLEQEGSSPEHFLEQSPSEGNRLERNGQSMMELGNSRLEELEKKLEEKEKIITSLTSNLEELKVALSQSNDIVLQLEHESHRLSRSQETLLARESELSRVKEKLASTENANLLLKEQIELNGKVDKSSLSFNPELIVRLSKEVDQLKKQLASRTSEKINEPFPSEGVTNVGGGGVMHAQTIQRMDKSTSTEIITNLKISSVETSIPAAEKTSSRLEVEDLTEDKMAKEKDRVTEREIHKSHDLSHERTAIAGRNVPGKNGSHIDKLNVSLEDGRNVSHKSHIPVLQKASKSESLDGEGIEIDTCNRVKCVQLETRLLILKSTVEDQSRQISHYQDLLRDLQPSSPGAKRHTPSTSPVSPSHQHPLHVKGTPTQRGSQKVEGKEVSAVSNHGETFSDTYGADDTQRSEEFHTGGLNGVAYKRVSGSDVVQPSSVMSTPFDATKAANQEEFIKLKSEVRRLQALHWRRDASLLNDTIQMYRDGSVGIPDASSLLPLDVLTHSRAPSASAEEFLHKLVESQKWDIELLRQNLERSYQSYHLLRARLEGLLEYLKRELQTTDDPLRLSALENTLTYTRNLISDLPQELNTSYESSIRMSQTTGDLLRFDLDRSSLLRIEDKDQLYREARQSLINRDVTFSDALSDADLEKKQLEYHIGLLERECGELERQLHQKETELDEGMRQKDLELESVAAEASSSREQVSSLWNDLETVRMSLHGAEADNSVLKLELVELKKSNQSLQETLVEFRGKVEELAKIQNELDKENDVLRLALTEQSAKLGAVNEELINREAQRLDELNLIKDDQQRKLAEFEVERRSLLTKVELLTLEIQELKVEVIRERDRWSAAEVAKDSCMKKLLERDSMIQKLKELIKDNQKAAEDLRTQLHRLSEELLEKKTSIWRLSRRCQDLENSVLHFKASSGSMSESAFPAVDGSGVASQPVDRLTELSQHLESSGSGGRASVGGFPLGRMSPKVADCYEFGVAQMSTSNQKQDPVLQELDCLHCKPKFGAPEMISVGCHSTAVPQGVKTTDPLIFGQKFTCDFDVRHFLKDGNFKGVGVHGSVPPESVNREDMSADAALRSRLAAAEELIAVLKKELKLRGRMDKSAPPMREGDTSLEEHLEEIKLLRKQLEQSLAKNDQLRILLMQQLKQGDAEVQSTGSGSNDRELNALARDLTMAKSEISIQDARLCRLRSELKERITQLETLEAEKISVLRQIDASKASLQNVQAEARRMKEALEENSDLGRVMRMELWLMNDIKTHNKENEQGMSLGPSRHGSGQSPSGMQMTNLLTEIRQLRIELEKAIDNNNVLRRDLEELSRRKAGSGTDGEAVSNQSRTKSSSRSTLKRTAESIAHGSANKPNGTIRILAAGSMDPSSTETKRGSPADSQSIFAVADGDAYEGLKSEVVRNQAVVEKLEKSIRAIHSEVIEDDRKKDLTGLAQEMRTVVAEQTRLLALFWILNLSKSDQNGSLTVTQIENTLLRKQLSDLRERYTRAKQAMKGAQERLEANNRRKEEFFMMHKNRKEQAMLLEIDKTHQVLVEARQNLETFHNQSSANRGS